ncbi:MAG: hypothetical protein GY868_06150 [Deltaproteobacteria bacterium]|nr:hypothetical protein [Deltaproteobacteria bacterium]
MKNICMGEESTGMKQKYRDQLQTYRRLKEVIGDEQALDIATAGFTYDNKKDFLQFIGNITTVGRL